MSATYLCRRGNELSKLQKSAQKSSSVAVEIDEDTAEWDYGGYEGLTTQQILERKSDWDMWRDGCPPGAEYPGESPEQMMERVDRVVAKVRAVQKKDLEEQQPDESGRDVIIVSHGDFSRAFVARWLNLPLDSWQVSL
ncbi:hypothetical protein QFC21_003919 [Naganishia friedmannii]|uniref:Uncharacterized protein n=1 Tax=Naganishia friedmannii TaxID=89922 RepID=A0ACC2VLN1_9TREE|nr:hypothetical protein QFC21_003919 [Naganishia friedmannii]